MDSELSGIAEKELNWCSCTCLYPESLLLSFPSLSFSLLVLFLRRAILEATGPSFSSFSTSHVSITIIIIRFCSLITIFYSNVKIRKLNILYVEENAFLAGLMKVIVGRCLGKKRIEQVARQDRKKKRTVDGRQEGGRDARGGRGFLLGPIKKPVSSSVSKSLLWHSRQLRKHLKAPEKPDNTSLVECRVPLGGRRDFAPCQLDTLRSPCVAISTLSYVLNIECPPRADSESNRTVRDILESKKFLDF